MRYFRLEENAMDHPKFIAISANAFRLWCEGTAYCQKLLTDGWIPRTAVKGFRYYTSARVVELLALNVPDKGPLWHEEGERYRVHDYLDWNETREKVLAGRKAGKDRLDRWRKEQAEKRHGTPPHETRYETPHRTPSDTPSKQNGTEQNSPPERAPGERAVSRARGLGAGVMAGALPREHLKHAFCGRKCVPDFLHGEFVQSVGGADPDGTVRQFYADVMDGIPDDQPIGEEPLKFWRMQFRARFGGAAVNPRTAGNLAAAAAFAARGRS